MTQATAEPAPETAGLEHSDPATNARLRKAAFHATRLYPGPVGELIADELLAVEAWGYRIAATSRAHRLTEHVLDLLDAEQRTTYPAASSSPTTARPSEAPSTPDRPRSPSFEGGGVFGVPERRSMPTSYNGWPAAPGWSISGGQLAALVVAGESFAPGVLRGDVHTVFQYLANQLHARVEPVYAPGWHPQDDWGYSYRQNRNANNLSCHASGTAIDYNATRHPNGRRGTFSTAQVAEIRRILAELDGVVRWGGDFTGTPDEMHFEIIKSAAEVARVAAKLRGGVTPTSPPPGVQYEPFQKGVTLGSRTLKLGSAGDDVAFVQRWHGITADGYFGPQTEAKVKATQQRNKLVVDGIVGPATWAVMGVGKPPAAPKRVAPPFPLPKGHYYGPITGPAQSHGGYYAWEKDEIRLIQAELIRRGHVPGKTNPDTTTWDDGIYSTPTVEAVKRFQQAVGLPVDGLVGPQTWAKLFS